MSPWEPSRAKGRLVAWLHVLLGTSNSTLGHPLIPACHLVVLIVPQEPWGHALSTGGSRTAKQVQ